MHIRCSFWRSGNKFNRIRIGQFHSWFLIYFVYFKICKSFFQFFNFDLAGIVFIHCLECFSDGINIIVIKELCKKRKHSEMKLAGLVTTGEIFHDQWMNSIFSSKSICFEYLKPFVIHLLLVTVSVFGNWLQHSLDPVLSIFWNWLPQIRFEFVITCHDFTWNFLITLAIKRRLSRQNKVSKNAHAPIVTWAVVVIAFQNFGRNEIYCSAICLQINFLLSSR